MKFSELRFFIEGLRFCSNFLMLAGNFTVTSLVIPSKSQKVPAIPGRVSSATLCDVSTPRKHYNSNEKTSKRESGEKITRTEEVELETVVALP